MNKTKTTPKSSDNYEAIAEEIGTVFRVAFRGDSKGRLDRGVSKKIDDGLIALAVGGYFRGKR